MKGLETRFIYGLIILIAVIIIIAIIVFLPALGFGKSTQSNINFQEFCVFWSLNNYKEGLGENVTALPITTINRNPEYYCSTPLGKSSLDNADIERCRSCCKKEIPC